MKAIITAILIILLLIGCRNNSEQQSDTYFQRTGVSFTTGNEALQELFDSAETKVEKNIIQYNDEYRVMVEGAVYPFVFLETQPMAGGMYAKCDLEIGYNNNAVFLKNQREDADFWSATEYNSSHAWFRNIHFNDNDVGRNKYPRQTGFAVRCVKD